MAILDYLNLPEKKSYINKDMKKYFKAKFFYNLFYTVNS